MPHYNANIVKYNTQRILTPGDLNWVQHWVSKTGLSDLKEMKQWIN